MNKHREIIGLGSHFELELERLPSGAVAIRQGDGPGPQMILVPPELIYPLTEHLGRWVQFSVPDRA